MVYIVKRDGSRVLFNKDKIVIAINKAFIEVDSTLYETDTANDIADEIYNIARSMPNNTLSVEDVQDLIEDYLMRSERKDVARSYIRYRYRKEVARNYTDDFITAIGQKIKGENMLFFT